MIYFSRNFNNFIRKITMNTFHSTPRQPASRKLSQGHVKTIGTHNGCFHCDEVLACFMLKQLPEYSDAEIIRTRDVEVLKTCDIVVDVGGVFDPATLRFDHHQREFKDTMSSLKLGKPWTTRLSSAGLIYAHFGEAVIAQILDKSKNDEVVGQVYDKVYENFIEEVDAVDNGIMVNDEPTRYRVTTTLSNRVSYLNPSWRDPKPDEMQGFMKAFQMVGSEFLERVHYFANDWWEAYSAVKIAFENRFDVDPAHGQIIDLRKAGCPWKDHLFKIEKESGMEGHIKFVLFESKDCWRVQAVPIAPDSFICRIPLLEEWRGVRDKDLEELSGIPTIVFVHASGFIGGAHERDSVLRMAKESINHGKNNINNID